MNAKKKYIFVFDMDNCLVGDYFDVLEPKNTYRVPILNTALLQVLKVAIEGREKGTVEGIYLLTNNSDEFFIERVKSSIAIALGVNKVFDEVSQRKTPGRINDYRFNTLRDKNLYKAKRVEDVKDLLKRDRKYNPSETDRSLMSRIFFFDDNHHILSEELTRAGFKENVFFINPCFSSKNKDTTDYSSIYKKLGVDSNIPNGINTPKGGRRIQRTRRKTKIYRSKFLQYSRKNARTTKENN